MKVAGALQYEIRAAFTADGDCGLRAAISKGQYRLGSPVVPLQAVELASEIATDFEVMIALCIRRVRRFTRPVVIQIATGGLAVASKLKHYAINTLLPVYQSANSAHCITQATLEF